LFAYGPADATAVPQPHHLVLHLNPDWSFLVPGCPGKVPHVHNTSKAIILDSFASKGCPAVYGLIVYSGCVLHFSLDIR